MRFEVPANLLFASLIGGIVLLYILKARRRDVLVSSTYLWESLLRDIEASTPWQRLRHNLLMYLQILAIALLALALARPSLISGAVLGRSTAIILDASASMRATDVSPSRFAWSLARAQQIVSAMRGADSVAIILMEETPRPVVPFTTDRGAAQSALSSLSAGYGRAAFKPAYSLAASMLKGRPSPRIVLLSDGAGLEVEEVPITPGIEFEHLLAGAPSAPNFGIVSLGARPWGDGLAALIRVGNFGGDRADATLEVFSDALSVYRRTIPVEAGKVADITVEGLSAAHLISARVTASQDRLLEDNIGYYLPGNGSELAVMLVTRGNLFLERALKLRPSTDVYTVSPEKYAPSARYGLYVFDGWLPSTLPDSPVLVFDPSAPVGPVTPGPQASAGRLSVENSEHPVMKFIDLADVSILNSRKLEIGAGAITLASRGGPTIASWQGAKARGITVGFDVRNTDWPLRPSFPIFILNSMEWLAPPSVAPGSHIALKPITLSLPSWAERAIVTDSTGNRYEIGKDSPSKVFTPPSPGLFSLEVSAKERRETALFAAQIAREESSIQCKAVTLQGGTPAQATALGRPIWPQLAALALAVLTLEWWLFNRGI